MKGTKTSVSEFINSFEVPMDSKVLV